MSNLFKRVSVALVGIPLAILIIFLGGYYFLSALIIISSFCIWELNKITEKKGTSPLLVLSAFFNILILFTFYYFLNSNFILSIFSIVILLILYNILNLGINLFNKNTESIFNISSSVLSVNYITLFFLTLLGLREFSIFQKIISNNSDKLQLFTDNESSWLILAIFITIWASDSAAYFIGTAFGKHRLFERVSPKKSWEGAIAGFVFSVIAFTITIYFSISSFNTYLALAIGGIIGITGTIGDLVESLIKRDAKVKDSSNIIPGHGGFLDRFDSILFVSPIVFVTLLLYYMLNFGM